MKVVLCKDKQGFKLSKTAIFRLYELGSSHIDSINPEVLYGDDYKSELSNRLMNPNDNICLYNGIILNENYSNTNAARSCDLLIQIVEELEKKAFVNKAQYEVVEIPDNIEFSILIENGVETLI